MAARQSLTIPALDRIPWLRYAITERDSASPVGGDMSFTTGGSDPIGIASNRRRALTQIGRAPEEAVVCGLVHGTAVRVVDRWDGGRGVLTPSNAIKETDGLITRDPGLALMMWFADCVPLVVVETRQRIIGLAHAGWRGTLAGMAGAIVGALCDECDSNPRSLIAVIGPSIGPGAYTVGDEVVTAFSRTYPEDTLFTNDVRRARLDLWEANRLQFVRAGVRPEAISCAGICTLEHGARFFSHRYAQAHGEREGRFAVLLSMEG